MKRRSNFRSSGTLSRPSLPLGGLIRAIAEMGRSAAFRRRTRRCSVLTSCRTASVIALALLISTVVRAQSRSTPPPPAAQNPSPMEEHTRAHLRVSPGSIRMVPRVIDAGLPVPVSVYVYDAPESGAFDLLIHFMGAAYVPAAAVERAKTHHAVAVVHLGSGSSVFERPFMEAGAFDRTLDAITREVRAAWRKPVDPRRIDLSAFSAGYGAVRAILRADADRISGVLLLDGLHTSYIPERTVLANGGRLDTTLLSPFLNFAQRATAGEKSFIVTHSEIFPGTFASTTETSDYLLDELGLERTSVLKWGPVGMQQLSETRSGRFVVLGFAGNTAPDHVDHLHGMAAFLDLLEPI